jgi:hypothetical protein
MVDCQIEVVASVHYFVCDGNIVNPTDTAISLGINSGDYIDALKKRSNNDLQLAILTERL